MSATRTPSQEHEFSKPPEDANQLIAESSTRHMDAGIKTLLPSKVDNRSNHIISASYLDRCIRSVHSLRECLWYIHFLAIAQYYQVYIVL